MISDSRNSITYCVAIFKETGAFKNRTVAKKVAGVAIVEQMKVASGSQGL